MILLSSLFLPWLSSCSVFFFFLFFLLLWAVILLDHWKRVYKEPDFTILRAISKLETPKENVCDPSRVDCSEFRDESISSVKNQEYQVATRSTAAIATSNVMEIHWLASHELPSTLFHRSRFCRCKRTSIIGSTFQILHGDVKILKNNRNKRPFAIESDEDDWLYSYFFRFQLVSTAAYSCSIITDTRNIYIFLRSTKFFGKKKKQTTSSCWDFRQIPSQTFVEFLLGLSEVPASSIKCPFEFKWGKCFLRDKLIILVRMP